MSQVEAYSELPLQVSRDVLQRWTFPFTPDTNLLRLPPSSQAADSSTYSYARGNTYRRDRPLANLRRTCFNLLSLTVPLPFREHSVSVARSAHIGRDTSIGANTEVQDDAQVCEQCCSERRMSFKCLMSVIKCIPSGLHDVHLQACRLSAQ